MLRSRLFVRSGMRDVNARFDLLNPFASRSSWVMASPEKEASSSPEREKKNTFFVTKTHLLQQFFFPTFFLPRWEDTFALPNDPFLPSNKDVTFTFFGSSPFSSMWKRISRLSSLSLSRLRTEEERFFFARRRRWFRSSLQPMGEKMTASGNRRRAF